MQCKPITSAKDLIGGTHYIHVEICIDGTMYLEPLVPCGQPFKDGYGWKVRNAKGSRHSPHSYLRDVGVYRHDPDNYHRTFKHNTVNRRVLTELVEGQDLEGYLRLIGVKNIEAVIEGLQNPSLNNQNEDNPFFDFDDDDDWD